jgi:DNA topoisomerase IB
MLNINIKYKDTYTYEKGNIYYKSKLIDKNDIIYKIIDKYNSLINTLTNVKIIPYKSIKEADKGLIYKGFDKNGKEQYVYGEEYILQRKKNKIKIFLKVYDKLNIIQELISIGIKEEIINKSFIFTTILLLEMAFFIRLGKDIYYKNNKTTGILTLQKKNIFIYDDYIDIIFIGKTNKEQKFVIYKQLQPILYNVLVKLYKNQPQNDYLFVTCDNIRYTEKMLNNKLKKINLTLKDFRTYGVNIIFIKQIFENFFNNDIKNIKKIISKSINETADIIGHTKNISKKSYLAEELQELLENILQNNIKYDTFESFLNLIINKLKKKLK